MTRLMLVAVCVVLLTQNTGAVYKGSFTATHPEVAFVGGCSGVLIGPKTVLTSWHCNKAINISVGTYSRSGHTIVQLGGIDLGYACLSSATTGVKKFPSVGGESEQTCSDVEVFGNGLSKATTYTEWSLDLDRYLRDELLTGYAAAIVGTSKIVCTVDAALASVPVVPPTLTANPSVPCYGDSGGPVYKAGTMELIGIVDEYPPPHGTASCGNDMRFIDMIKNAALAARAKKACGDPP